MGWQPMATTCPSNMDQQTPQRHCREQWAEKHWKVLLEPVDLATTPTTLQHPKVFAKICGSIRPATPRPVNSTTPRCSRFLIFPHHSRKVGGESLWTSFRSRNLQDRSSCNLFLRLLLLQKTRLNSSRHGTGFKPVPSWIKQSADTVRPVRPVRPLAQVFQQNAGKKNVQRLKILLASLPKKDSTHDQWLDHSTYTLKNYDEIQTFTK